MASTFNARDAAVYERSMGRWSRRLAPGFAVFAGIGRAQRVLDVGCGTGSLVFELADNPAHQQLVGIDASDIYLSAAQAQVQRQPGGAERFAFHHGDACAMPFVEDEFDAALCQLVLQFVPQPGEAVAEMRRVVRPGGTVAAAVWNSGGGMPHQRMFWDTAAMLDPAAAELRGKTFSRPMTRQDDLYGLFERVGLREVAESTVTIPMDFADFDDFWSPIAGGEGTLGKYVLGLDADATARLETALRNAYESGQPDGKRHFSCTAFVCRGTV